MDARVSPPQHAAKLPSWSHPWYHWFCQELVHHIYISYCNSLMFCLPPLRIPCFRSEEEPYVLMFPNISRYCCPWGAFAIGSAHRYSSLLLDYSNSPYCLMHPYCLAIPVNTGLLSLLSLYFTYPHVGIAISSTHVYHISVSRVSCAI